MMAPKDTVTSTALAKHRWMMLVGTRPEVIKMAPVFRAAEALGGVAPILVSSGQHRDLLDTALADFSLTPSHDLQVMQPNQNLTTLTARVLEGLAPVLQQEKPTAMLVQGDTTTAFAGALAAFYAGVPVYHVEAGLRSHRLDAPFPEEANRSLIGRIARQHFAPTETARANLLREGIQASDILVTGNTVIDALLWMKERCQQAFPGNTSCLGRAAEGLLRGQKFILVTAHRRENFGEGVVALCDGLRRIATSFPEVAIVFPVHPNPNIREPIHARLGDLTNIHLLAPMGYGPFVWLLDRCHAVITDSGGVQEEAATLGKPLIVTREVTERGEAVAGGGATLTGMHAGDIAAQMTRLLSDAAFYQTMATPSRAYGDGSASRHIVAAVAQSSPEKAVA